MYFPIAPGNPLKSFLIPLVYIIIHISVNNSLSLDYMEMETKSIWTKCKRIIIWKRLYHIQFAMTGLDDLVDFLLAMHVFEA